MDNPTHLYNTDINDTLFDSNYTTISSQPSTNWYNEQRSHSRHVLTNWGLTLGEMPYSPDN